MTAIIKLAQSLAGLVTISVDPASQKVISQNALYREVTQTAALEVPRPDPVPLNIALLKSSIISMSGGKDNEQR